MGALESLAGGLGQAAPATGPGAPFVEAAAVAAAAFGATLKLLSQAHKYADQLTRPNEGAQWVLQYQTLPQIIDPLAVKEAAGQATRADEQNAIDALMNVHKQFDDYLQQAGFLAQAAGKQAKATIDNVIDGVLIPDRQRRMAALPAGFLSTFSGETTGLLDSIGDFVGGLTMGTPKGAPPQPGAGMVPVKDNTRLYLAGAVVLVLLWWWWFKK